MATPLFIISVVFNYFDVPINMRDNHTRKAAKVTACQYSMYFLRKYTSHTNEFIGRIFRRDHATVTHAVKKINTELATYKDTQRFIEQINNRILAGIQIDDFKYAQYETDNV